MKFNIKYFSIGLLLSISAGYYLGAYDSIESTNITSNNNGSTTSVEIGTIRESMEVVGDTELVDEQSITFNKVGTVTDVYFSEGDTVRKGETIARLDESDAYRSIEDAKLSLANAKISLSQLYEEEDTSKIQQAENSIITSENSYDTAVQELENLKITQANSITKLANEIINYKTEIENTKLEKDNSLTTKESSKNTTVVKIEDNFQNYLISIEDIIESADTILGVTKDRKNDNDDYEQYLGAKNTAVKNQAKTSLTQSISLYQTLSENIEVYNSTGSQDEMVTLLNEFLTIYNSLYDTTDLLYEAIDSSITSVGSLSENDISAMKQEISQARSNSLSKIDSINSDINSLNGLVDTDLELSSSELIIKKMETNLLQLASDFDTTQTRYEIELNSKIKDIDNKKDALSIAKINLEELLEGPTEYNVEKTQNSITQAELKLAAAYEDLEDYILTAPFDGVIRKSDYLPGDNLKDDNDKYVYIENPNLLEVNVMLDQIDIVNIELGGVAIVTFDTYPTIPVNAKISNIDTTPVRSSSVVSYEVKVILDDPTFDKKVLSGMTADVEIINELKEDILIVKSLAISEEDGKNYVTLQDGETTKQVEVETGITSGGMTEIISGLEEGDKVIVKEFVYIAEEEEESTSLFGTTTVQSGPGGGGGGPGGR